MIRRAITFAVSFAVPLWLALNGGGFDVAVRQESGLVLWWAIAVGFAIGALPRGGLDREIALPAVALVGLVAWTILSFSWTESDERTFAELARVIGYAGILVVAWASLNRYTFRAAAAGLSAAALAIAALAVASRLAPASFPVDEIAVAFDTDRLNYPFDYWNAVAACGAIAVAVGLSWSAHARHAIVRGVALAGVPVAALAVYLAYSRGGILASALAVVLAIALGHNRWTVTIHALAAGAGAGAVILVARANPAIADATGGEGGGAVAAAILLAALWCGGVTAFTSFAWIDRVRLPADRARYLVPAVLAAVLVAGAVVGQAAVSRGWDEFVNDDVSAQKGETARLGTAGGDRNDVWGSALDAFGSSPLTGIGPGGFELWWSRDGRLEAPTVDAHSLYFETLAELGIVGLLLLVGFLGALVYAALRTRALLKRTADLGASAAAITAGLVYLFHAGLDWFWEYPALVLLGIGGLAIATVAAAERQSGPLPPRVRAAAVGVALCLGAIQIPGIVTTERVRDSEVALSRGDLEAARQAASDAARAQPWASSPLAQRALVEEAMGDLAAARADLVDAGEKEPTNWRWPAQLARVETKLGNRGRAADAQAEADRLNLVSP